MAYGQNLDLEAITSNDADDPKEMEPITEEMETVTEAVYGESPIVPFAIPADKTAVLTGANLDFSLAVTQNNVTISEGGDINGRSSFKIALDEIKIPVRGDDANAAEADIILKGDTVVLDQATYFKHLKLATAGPTWIQVGGQNIAQIAFAEDAITIVFNGVDDFFDGRKQNVTMSFTADAVAFDQTPGETIDTQIFGHDYKLTNPALEAQYSITLADNRPSGYYSWTNGTAFAEGTVEWKAVIVTTDKNDPSIPMPLDGLIFSSNLMGVGEYVEGSFKVDDNEATPSIDSTTKVLTYTFPEDDSKKGQTTILFKTWIPKEKYYKEYDGTNGGLVSVNTNWSQTISNSVSLLSLDNSELKKSDANVAITPDWIQQYGKLTKDGADTLITWTIDVNKRNFHRGDSPKEGLQNITIFDKLPAGLEFVSATYSVGGADRGSITPTGDLADDYTFSIGDADAAVQLVIITKKTGAQTEFTNVPKVTWGIDPKKSHDQNNTDGVTATTKITVGNHAFTKSSAWQRTTASVKWTITANFQYQLDDAAVYDLLVHGNSLDFLDELDPNPDVTSAMITEFKKLPVTHLNQKYRKGTLTTSGGLTGEVVQLKSRNKHVADLVKVTGFKSGKDETVSFESASTIPEKTFTGGGILHNRAFLFDGDSFDKSADQSDGRSLLMLGKEILYAAQPLDANGDPYKVHAWRRKNAGEMRVPILNDANWYMRGTDVNLPFGYDRQNKTVTFRLIVNRPAYNTEEIIKDGRIASNITLVDTLPNGWEFVEYAPGKDFELMAGSTSAGVDGGNFNWVRSHDVLDPTGIINFSKNGNVGTFSFHKLERTYIILVKARPTNEKLATYQLGDNFEVNNAEFSMKWDEQVFTESTTQPFIVPFQTLNKVVSKPATGIQEWTINYTPPMNVKSGAYLEDTLSPGLHLNKNLDDTLDLDSIKVYPGKLQPNGRLVADGSRIDLKAPNSEISVTFSIDPTTNAESLKFLMSNPNKFYLITYQTECENNPALAGTTVSNSVKLGGDDNVPNISATSSIQLSTNDVTANANDTGTLYLQKFDPDNKPLAGVKFEVFDPDGITPAKDKNGTPLGEKITDAQGKTSFLFNKAGDYVLRQTYIDETTYLPTTVTYKIRVIAKGTNTWTVLVDGKLVTQTIPFPVPTPAQGKLTVKNIVEGNSSDPQKEFQYSVTFEGEGSTGSFTWEKGGIRNGADNRFKSGNIFTLKHGESFHFPALPAGVKYTVTQTSYVDEGYITEPGLALRDTIEYNVEKIAGFKNAKNLYGSLQISNTVTGNGGDTKKEFEFTVTLGDNPNVEYEYTKIDGSTGKIKTGDKITLKHNETITIKDLPKGIEFKVTETDYSAHGYTTTPSLEQTGNIEIGTNEIPFTNTRNLPGALVLKTRPKGDPNAPTDLSKVPGDGKTPAELIATLTDREGKPIPNAEITLWDKDRNEIGKTTTDTNGVAVIEFTPDKVVNITAVEYPFIATTTKKTSTGVPYDPSNEVRVIATPAQLYGILRDNNTGKVIPNADVTIRNVKTGETVTIKTDENGSYRHPVNRDEEYTITYGKIVNIGGVDTLVPFTQKATTEDNTTVEGTDIPAEITAVGIVLFKEPDGTSSMIKDEFAGKLRVYLKDKDGKYIEENSKPKAFPLDPTYGTFSAEGLSEEVYTMEVRYEFEPGKELIVAKAALNVKANGELNISEELVDPYGTVYDKATGEKIQGAKITLYYADTQRNRDKGITPGAKVNLPLVPNFAPNDNLSPSQNSDIHGFYAYMVYPEADYYLIVTKPGYKTYTSETISVEWDIVRYDVPMVKESSGGGNGGSGGNSSSGSSKDTTPLKSVDVAVDLKTNQRSFLEETEVKLNIEYKDKKGNAKNAELIVTLAEGVEVVDAKGGKVIGNTIVWKLGDLKEGEIGSKTLVIKLPKISSSEVTLKLKAEITAGGELIYLLDDVSTLNLSVFSNRFDSKHHKRYIQGYPDGMFKPDRTITRAEIAVAFARILELDTFVKNEQIYSDVQLDAWYARGVEAATRRGLFNGYEGGRFRPDQAITRAELAAVISRFLELSERSPVKESFKDIDDHWALGYIAELYRNNVVTGYRDSTFKPDAPLKRSEAVTMINRMLNRGPLKGIAPSFPDVDTEHWANGDVEESTRSHDYYRNSDSSETHIRTVHEELYF